MSSDEIFLVTNQHRYVGFKISVSVSLTYN